MNEAARDRARKILTNKLHPRTDGFGLHPDFIESIVDELFPPLEADDIFRSGGMTEDTGPRPKL